MKTKLRNRLVTIEQAAEFLNRFAINGVKFDVAELENVKDCEFYDKNGKEINSIITVAQENCGGFIELLSDWLHNTKNPDNGKDQVQLKYTLGYTSIESLYFFKRCLISYYPGKIKSFTFKDLNAFSDEFMQPQIEEIIEKYNEDMKKLLEQKTRSSMIELNKLTKTIISEIDKL